RPDRHDQRSIRPHPREMFPVPEIPQRPHRTRPNLRGPGAPDHRESGGSVNLKPGDRGRMIDRWATRQWPVIAEVVSIEPTSIGVIKCRELDPADGIPSGNVMGAILYFPDNDTEPERFTFIPGELYQLACPQCTKEQP